MQLCQYSIERVLLQFVFVGHVIGGRAYYDVDELMEVGIWPADLELTQQL